MESITTARRDGGEGADNATYQAILCAARELIDEFGYHDITVDQVRRLAKVSRATFYFYFRNKRHLFLKVANNVMNQLCEVAGRHYPDKDEFSRIVLANVAYLEVWARETKIIGEFFALSLIDAEIHRIYDRHRRRFEERIEGRLARLLAQGRIPPTDTRLLAATLSAMVEFFAFRFFATDEEKSKENYRFHDAVRILSESWYRAVYGRTPPDGYPYERHQLQGTSYGLS